MPLTIAEDAFTRNSDGDGVAAFSATFGFDDLLLAVTSTGPAVGSTIVLPLLSLVVNFNEPIDSSSVEPGDLIAASIEGLGSAFAQFT